jgi:cobalt/nickel transport system permease protein
MFIIDQIAYNNRLRKAHPAEKIAFSLCTLIISLFSTDILPSLAIVILMSGVLIICARIPARRLLTLLLIPSAFLITGVLAVMMTISQEHVPHAPALQVGCIWIALSHQGFQRGLSLFLRALSSLCCLYFLILTTPFVELVSVMKRLHVPGFIIELFSLVYRGIFIFYEMAGNISLSQGSRLGYSGIRNSLHSCAHLASSLFIKSYACSQNIYLALLARGYDGEMEVLEPEYAVSAAHWIFIAIAEALVLGIMWWGGKILG